MISEVDKSKKLASSADWKIDFDTLKRSFSSKTKMIMLNNPCNPIGKVFSQQELEQIAELAEQHDVIVMSDEVYEWHVYPPSRHIRFASLPNMFDRTLTIGSAGKSFSVTGWKVGWVYGPQTLVAACVKSHQFITFCGIRPLQDAVSVAFRSAEKEKYFPEMNQMFLSKRNRLLDALVKAKMIPFVPDGSYFVVADTSNISAPPPPPNSRKDYEFCKWMTKEKQLTAIPVSAFYSADHAHLAEKYIRFCFCKTDEMMENAFEKLEMF